MDTGQVASRGAGLAGTAARGRRSRDGTACVTPLVTRPNKAKISPRPRAANETAARGAQKQRSSMDERDLPVTIPGLQRMKRHERKIVAVVAWDYQMAQIV